MAKKESAPADPSKVHGLDSKGWEAKIAELDNELEKQGRAIEDARKKLSAARAAKARAERAKADAEAFRDAALMRERGALR